MNKKRVEYRSLKSLSLFIVAAISAVFLGISSARQAVAQIETVPSWAVLDFVDESPGERTDIGQRAAAKMAEELAKVGSAQRQQQFEIVPQSTVARAVNDLNLVTPVTDPRFISRVGLELQSVSVVTGQIKNYRIREIDGGRQAQVIMRTLVYDTASGMVINGAAINAESQVRANDVADSVLIDEALTMGANETVRLIVTRLLPSATVLNTVDRQALVNRGRRAGFEEGMEVIVIRGTEQVASGRIASPDFDSAYVNIERSTKGVQPGDRVRAVFSPPNIAANWSNDGSARVERRRSGDNSGIFALLLVVLALVFLLGGGRGGSGTLVTNPIAEATVLGNDVPANRISWTRDAFLRGNQEGPVQWQVWRDGVNTGPVAVADGTQSFVFDDALGSNARAWFDFGGIVGGIECQGLPGASDNAPNGVIPGIPYTYQIEVIYRINSLSLPGVGGTAGGGGATTGGGGVTGGGTTGGGTTGGTTGITGGGTTGGTTGGGTTGGTTGGGGGEGEFCYFASSRVPTVGQATPFVRPQLRQPANNATVATPITFQFDSVRGPVGSVQIEYVIQFSTVNTFPNDNRTMTMNPFLELIQPGGSNVSSPVIDTSTVFPQSQTLFWRVGARNPMDNPGPVPGPGGLRYIFSQVRSFQRATTPPAPPAN